MNKIKPYFFVFETYLVFAIWQYTSHLIFYSFIQQIRIILTHNKQTHNHQWQDRPPPTITIIIDILQQISNPKTQILQQNSQNHCRPKGHDNRWSEGLCDVKERLKERDGFVWEKRKRSWEEREDEDDDKFKKKKKT